MGKTRPPILGGTMADIVSMRADAEAARKRIDDLLGVEGELSTDQVSELEKADSEFRSLRDELKRHEVVESARESSESRSFEPKPPMKPASNEIFSNQLFVRNLKRAIDGSGPREDRAIDGTASGDAAAALMPVDLQDQMVRRLAEVSAMRKAATVVSFDNDVEMPITATRASITAYTGESETADPLTPTFAKLRFRSYKSSAQTLISDEVLADSRGGVVSETVQQHAEAHAYFWEQQYLGAEAAQSPSNVDGVFATTGFTSAFGSNLGPADVTGAGNTYASVTYDNLIETTLAMPAQYWSLPKSWIVSPGMFTELIKLEDAGGRKLYQPQSLGALPDAPNIPTLLGYPVYVSQAMPAEGTGEYAAVLLERSSYMIADRVSGGQVNSQIDPFSFGESGQVAFRSQLRSDGRWVRPVSSSRLVLA